MERNISRFLLLLISSCLLALQLGCASESLGGDSESSGGDECPTVGDLNIESSSGLGGGQFCLIGGTLTEGATITAPGDGFEWQLDGDITVEDVTLTISAGVEIFASGAEEYIYIQNGASININGTEASPVMLSQSTGTTSAEWGGLLIESLESGGLKQRIDYLVVTGAGQSVSVGGTEYNANISFIGEHSDTQVRFLQSHSSSGNGLEISSEADQNSALLENVLVTSPSAEGVSTTNFNGLLKNILVLQDDTNSSAGISFSGSATNPLVVNATFIGQDADTAAGDTKVGFLFDGFVGTDASFGPRIINSLIVNYRHGCYRVSNDSDLSAIDVDITIPDADESFIDAVHCVNEINSDSIDPAELAPRGNNELPEDDVNYGVSDVGLSFYVAAADFDYESSALSSYAGYYLDNIGGLSNGAEDLQRYNGGDTNNSGSTDSVDESESPLLDLDGIYEGIFIPGNPGDGTHFACYALDALPEGAEFRDEFGDAIDPQPDGAEVRCSFYLFIPDQGSKFNLTVIGAIESADDGRFDGWTISDGF